MIKINIDYSNATESEIATLNAIPGFKSSITEIQTNDRQYNTLMTVIEPGNHFAEVKALVMGFMREMRMEEGHAIPAKPYNFNFLPKLNPKQRDLSDEVLEALVVEGILTSGQDNYRLTRAGFDALY